MNISEKQSFLEFAIERGVLRFGEFTLKSGRLSPYFFNAGLFNTGEALARLGHYYAQAIVDSKVGFDMLFGPAYKGIPLVTTTAIALSEGHQLDLPWCFNRKETKDHGEGGMLVGAPLAGRVLVVDDVITAGTAIRESLEIILSAGATLAGVVISLNREERGISSRSAIQEVEDSLGIPVISIASLSDLVAHMHNDPARTDVLSSLEAYREQYGI